MERLNFKKVSTSLLMLAIVAGCTTNTPVNNVKAPVTKVDTVKVATPELSFDLGAKNGGTVKASLKFADQKKFAIKSDFPTNTSTLPLYGFHIELHLYRTPIGPGNNPMTPKTRYDALPPANLTDATLSGTVFAHRIDDPGSNTSITFHGLQQGFDYYMTARIYSPSLTISSKLIHLDYTSVSGTPGLYDTDRMAHARTPLTGQGVEVEDLPNFPGYKAVDLSGLGIQPTDLFYVGNIGYWAIVTSSPTASDNYRSFGYDGGDPSTGTIKYPDSPYYGSFWRYANYDYLNGTAPLAAADFTYLARNVVGIGDVGDSGGGGMGMAGGPNSYGGGTAPAFVNPFVCGCEERVHYDGTGGGIQIMWDTTPGNNTPNNTWDMVINLMQSIGANDINGNIELIPGGDAGGSTISG
jgi:hypothetical protein